MTSIIKVDTLQTAAGGVPTAADLGLNVTGSVLQVQSSVMTSSTGMASAAWIDTGLSVAITPRSTSSKFILAVSVTGSVGYFSFGIRLVRDGSAITQSLGNASGNKLQSTIAHNDYNAGSGDTNSSGGSNQYQMHTLAGSFHDTTSSTDTTTAITFKVQANFYTGGAINRSLEDSNNSSRHRCTSSLVVYEVEK